MLSQVSGISTVYSSICSWVHQRKQQNSVLLALCEGNPPVIGAFLSQRPRFHVMTSSWHRVLITGGHPWDIPTYLMHCYRKGLDYPDTIYHSSWWRIWYQVCRQCPLSNCMGITDNHGLFCMSVCHCSLSCWIYFMNHDFFNNEATILPILEKKHTMVADVPVT